MKFNFNECRSGTLDELLAIVRVNRAGPIDKKKYFVVIMYTDPSSSEQVVEPLKKVRLTVSLLCFGAVPCRRGRLDGTTTPARDADSPDTVISSSSPETVVPDCSYKYPGTAPLQLQVPRYGPGYRYRYPGALPMRRSWAGGRGSGDKWCCTGAWLCSQE